MRRWAPRARCSRASLTASPSTPCCGRPWTASRASPGTAPACDPPALCVCWSAGAWALGPGRWRPGSATCLGAQQFWLGPVPPGCHRAGLKAGWGQAAGPPGQETGRVAGLRKTLGFCTREVGTCGSVRLRAWEGRHACMRALGTSYLNQHGGRLCIADLAPAMACFSAKLKRSAEWRTRCSTFCAFHLRVCGSNPPAPEQRTPAAPGHSGQAQRVHMYRACGHKSTSAAVFASFDSG